MTTNNNLITTQLEEIIEQYVELVVDRMDTQSLVEYVTEDLTDRYNKMTSNELKEWIYEHEDEYLYDELVENVNIENDTQRYRHLQEVIDERRTDIDW